MFTKPTLVLVVAVAIAGAAFAGSQIESRLSNCSAINCAGETIRVTHQAAEPFVSQLFARVGECLRVDVTQQSADTGLMLLSPLVPLAVASDDRSDADTRPLLMLDELPWTGWYTLVVGFEGTGNSVVRAKVDYGRYPGGNANCAPPTAAAAQKFDRLVGDPAKVVSPPAADATDPPAE